MFLHVERVILNDSARALNIIKGHVRLTPVASLFSKVRRQFNTDTVFPKALRSDDGASNASERVENQFVTRFGENLDKTGNKSHRKNRRMSQGDFILRLAYVAPNGN